MTPSVAGARFPSKRAKDKMRTNDPLSPLVATLYKCPGNSWLRCQRRGALGDSRVAWIRELNFSCHVCVCSVWILLPTSKRQRQTAIRNSITYTTFEWHRGALRAAQSRAEHALGLIGVTMKFSKCLNKTAASSSSFIPVSSSCCLKGFLPSYPDQREVAGEAVQ